MRRFIYNEQGMNEVVQKTEKEVPNHFYHYWANEMIKAHKSPMITEKNCLEDWKIVGWAWEKLEDPND